MIPIARSSYSSAIDWNSRLTDGFGAASGDGMLRTKRPRLEDEVVAGRDYIDDVEVGQFPVRQFAHRQTRLPRQDFGHQAAMRRGHVLGDDIDAAKVGSNPATS